MQTSSSGSPSPGKRIVGYDNERPRASAPSSSSGGSGAWAGSLLILCAIGLQRLCRLSPEISYWRTPTEIAGVSALVTFATTSALPSRDTSTLALGITFSMTCIHRYSLSAANGKRPEEPLMM